MSLIFALLREDHIVFGADSRHVIGTVDARYLNDKSCKVERIQDGRGLFGFAGNDICEAIVSTVKQKRIHEELSLQLAVREVSEIACEIYTKRFPGDSGYATGNGVELLLAGFEGSAAKSYMMTSPGFGQLPRTYESGYDTFEIIGKRRHGALYAFRKCANSATSIESGLRLAYFTLLEVSQYDTAVGGEPQVYILRRDSLVDDQTEKLKAYKEWAADIGGRIAQLVTDPTSADR